MAQCSIFLVTQAGLQYLFLYLIFNNGRDAYKGRNGGFLPAMEQNTSLSEFQRSLPILKVAEMLEHTLNNLAGLDIWDPPTET